MEEEKKEKKDWCEETLEQLEKEIEKVNNEKINPENITYLAKVIDAHKDLMNEFYWKEKIYMYRDSYNNYDDYRDGSYGRRRRDSRGRYMDYYGRRGVPGTGRGRYRGEDMMDQIYRAYNDYMDEAEYGNYGTSESMQKIEIMADSLMDFVEHLKKEAKTPEERQLIDQKIQELSRM